MVKVRRSGTVKDEAPSDSALGRAVSGAVQAITGAVEAAAGRFRALIGKSSGSIRALDRQVSEIYQLAPAMIRGSNWSLDDDEVDDVVAFLVDDELRENAKWSFVHQPAKRRMIVRRAIHACVVEKSRARKRHDDAHHLYLAGDDRNAPWMSPTTKLEYAEADAVIRNAIIHMPPVMRAVYSAVTSGLTHPEVSARLGLSLPSIANHMWKANRWMAEAGNAWYYGRQPVFPKRGRPRKARSVGGLLK